MPRFKILGKYMDKNVKYNLIMAGAVITSIKVPENIFVKFFTCLLNENLENCEMYKDFLMDYDDIKSKKNLELNMVSMN